MEIEGLRCAGGLGDWGAGHTAGEAVAPLVFDETYLYCIGQVPAGFKLSDASTLPGGEEGGDQAGCSGGVWAAPGRCRTKCSNREAVSARTRFFGITPSRCSR